jgi:hypothetical protein
VATLGLRPSRLTERRACVLATLVVSCVSSCGDAHRGRGANRASWSLEGENGLSAVVCGLWSVWAYTGRPLLAAL